MSNWTDAELKAQAAFEKMGFDSDIADSLAGRGISVEDFESMTEIDILRHVAAWHLGDGE